MRQVAMYAVIRQGGRQYRVQPNEVIQIDLIEAEKGDSITLGNVLALRTDAGLVVGAPVVGGATVEAKVLRHDRGKKIVVGKFKRRKGYARKQGHRQDFTEVRILSISKDGTSLG